MKYLDFTYLRTNVTDDVSFIKQLLMIFLTSLDADVEVLTEAISNQNHEHTKSATHKVKSSFRSLGIATITDSLQTLENHAKASESFDRIQPLFDEFLRQLPDIREEVLAYLEDKS